MARHCPTKNTGLKAIEGGPIAKIAHGALGGCFAVTDGSSTTYGPSRSSSWGVGATARISFVHFAVQRGRGSDNACT